LHRPCQFMEDGTFEIAKDFDGAEKLVQVIGQARLRVRFLAVGKHFDKRFLALRARWQSRIHVHPSVPDQPAGCGDEEDQYEEQCSHIDR